MQTSRKEKRKTETMAALGEEKIEKGWEESGRGVGRKEKKEKGRKEGEKERHRDLKELVIIQ